MVEKYQSNIDETEQFEYPKECTQGYYDQLLDELKDRKTENEALRKKIAQIKPLYAYDNSDSQ